MTFHYSPRKYHTPINLNHETIISSQNTRTSVDKPNRAVPRILAIISRLLIAKATFLFLSPAHPPTTQSTQHTRTFAQPAKRAQTNADRIAPTKPSLDPDRKYHCCGLFDLKNLFSSRKFYDTLPAV